MAKEPEILDEERFHPRHIYGLSGHQNAEHLFLDAWQKGRLHHAWLISGPEGIGKATLAYRIARFVLSGGGQAEDSLFGDSLPPSSLHIDEEHPVAKRIAAQGHPDLMVLEKGMINPDTGKPALGQIPVSVTRKAVEFMHLTPADGDWRVVIVDNVDAMNRNAANAMLKALEEPPARALFLLISHAPGRLLPTIRSRCRSMKLDPLGNDMVASLLQNRKETLQPEEISAYIHLAEGSIGRALSLEKAGGITLYQSLMELLNAPQRMDMVKLHGLADILSRKGSEESYATFRTLFTWWWNRLIRYRIQNLYPPEILHGDQQTAQIIRSPEECQRWLDIFGKISADLQKTDPPSHLDRKQVLINAFLTLSNAAKGV